MSKELKILLHKMIYMMTQISSWNLEATIKTISETWFLVIQIWGEKSGFVIKSNPFNWFLSNMVWMLINSNHEQT